MAMQSVAAFFGSAAGEGRSWWVEPAAYVGCLALLGLLAFAVPALLHG